MASSRRRQSLSVIDQLQAEPYRFEFFQAVRLLEQAVLPGGVENNNFASEQLAGAAPPARELVRFKAQTSLSFVGADVLKVASRDLGDSISGSEEIATRDDQAEKQWLMEIGFAGLIGSQGVTPYYLTEVVHRELREKNAALRDFLDVFHHRNISLLYQAWHKYQLPVNYERGRLRQTREPDPFTQALAAVAGLGTSEMRYRMPVPDDALYGLAGHLGRQQCSAAALAGMIRQYFGLQVSIEQFQGQWDELPEDVLTRLPSPEYPQGVNNCLGVDTIMGTHCFQAQNKFRVVIEPMAYEDHMTIAPGSDKLEALKSFIQFSAGIEMDFEISVTLGTGQVAPVQLAADSEHQPLLGWNTHMSSDQEHDECVNINLSADQISPDEALPAA
ncbi:type VI secretion system baseplate subunit TssG [Microbulbifer sp. CAU 1566]|uniref:type VI secretion system baseplate subunit TssG n=1 Tax=Microbulbifer sp. CAU 1566 TaxID=2933269 RepID=UPI00249DDCA3|nr:type VI secretion system baseplate subunit TssG [Microbulbifer sp. CAU 1566]